jgi:hypothetical protein
MLQYRGGIPRIQNFAIDTTGSFVQFAALSMSVRIKTSSTIRIYADDTDFALDQNFYEIPATEIFEMPLEDKGLWFRGVGGTANVQCIVLHRKG